MAPVTPDVPTLEEVLAHAEQEAGTEKYLDGFSYPEIIQLTGMSPAKARRMVKTAIEQGKLTAHRSVRACVTRPGYNVSCTVFRVKV